MTVRIHETATRSNRDDWHLLLIQRNMIALDVADPPELGRSLVLQVDPNICILEQDDLARGILRLIGNRRHLGKASATLPLLRILSKWRPRIVDLEAFLPQLAHAHRPAPLHKVSLK